LLSWLFGRGGDDTAGTGPTLGSAVSVPAAGRPGATTAPGRPAPWDLVAATDVEAAFGGTAQELRRVDRAGLKQAVFELAGQAQRPIGVVVLDEQATREVFDKVAAEAKDRPGSGRRVPASGLGDAAYWFPDAGQLHVLTGNVHVFFVDPGGELGADQVPHPLRQLARRALSRM
jgi:hypothetical protein